MLWYKFLVFVLLWEKLLCCFVKCSLLAAVLVFFIFIFWQLFPNLGILTLIYYLGLFYLGKKNNSYVCLL